jgi:hypothetical protein
MKLTLIAFAILIITSCKKDNYIETNYVYVAGHIINGAISMGKYWKDGQPIDLPGNGDNYGTTCGIAISGNDVYVCGIYGGRGAYWKNGIPFPLGENASYVSSITVSGNDVYVAGIMDGVAAYWKNQQGIKLTDTLINSAALSIAVAGNDVYTAGFSGSKTVYWKNKQMVVLGDTVNTLWAKSICVSAGDVYVTDQRFDNTGAYSEYWKNGQSVRLNIDNQVYLQGNNYVGISVSNNNVYLVTTLSKLSGGNTFITYWKNGEAFPIRTYGDAFATGIAVAGNDVYISGYEMRNGRGIAKYWRNGRGISLSDGSQHEFANAIVVAPR